MTQGVQIMNPHLQLAIFVYAVGTLHSNELLYITLYPLEQPRIELRPARLVDRWIFDLQGLKALPLLLHSIY